MRGSSPRMTTKPWRTFMTRKLAAAAFALLAFSSFAYPQTTAPTNSLPNPYRTIDNWGDLPDGRKWGSTSAVAVDPDGTSVWVAERCGETRPPNQITPGNPFACAESTLDPIMKFDTNGKLLKSFGAGMVLFPHGLHVDREGNGRVTDGLGFKGEAHQVFKCSRDGKPSMAPGKAATPHIGPD